MICADASFAAKWLFPEEQHAEQALALLWDTLAQGKPIIAPPFLAAEVTTIIRQRMHPEGVSLERARELLGQFLALPAAYDAHYVALARRLGCDLWTDDQRLLRDLAGRLPFVRFIGDYVVAAP